jgi:3-dehydroquinate synthase
MEKIDIKILVHNAQKGYSIFIGRGILKDIAGLFDFGRYSKSVIVTDSRVAKLFLEKVKKAIPFRTNHIILPAGENHKNIKSVESIWRKLLECHSDRETLIVNLGGGVISDIGGFAASTFMRGLDFVQIPTTLLAQVDASIGGKTGINFLGIKNLIGTFQQPIGVVIDTQTLETLPKREFLSGFAEIIKHGLIYDKKYFFHVTSKSPLEFNSGELVEIITKSCRIKADIIQKDTTEKDLRKILNFGHTIGHAIEALSLKTDKPLLHGEAINIGMLIEAKISFLTGLLSLSEFQMIQDALGKTELPISANITDFAGMMKKMQNDKKNKNREVNWTLLKGIGQAVFDQKVENSIVKKALQSKDL